MKGKTGESVRILFVANLDKEHINKFHIPTIKELKKQGHIVDVMCAGNANVPYCDKRIYALWKRTPFSFSTFKGLKQFKKILKENDYDIIYCHTPVGGLIARVALIGKKNPPKVVYFAHGLHFYKGAPLINWILYYPIEKFLSRYVDMLITINEEDYFLVKNKFKRVNKIIKLPGVGVNFKRLQEISDNSDKKNKEKLGINDNQIVLIYVAELTKNKNQIMLLKTLKLFKENNKNVKLLLVGTGNNEEFLKKFSYKNNLSNNIEFLGWRDDIGELLNLSDICVASSIREGLGINLIEAMYMNLPIVASNNRGHKEIIENNVNGFLVDNYKEMYEKICLIIDDENIRKKFSCHNVQKYEDEYIALKICSLLNEFNK